MQQKNQLNEDKNIQNQNIWKSNRFTDVPLDLLVKLRTAYIQCFVHHCFRLYKNTNSRLRIYAIGVVTLTHTILSKRHIVLAEKILIVSNKDNDFMHRTTSC